MSALKDKFRQASRPERLRREDVTGILPADLFAGEQVLAVEPMTDDADRMDKLNYRQRRLKGGRTELEFAWEGARSRQIAFCLRDREGQRIFDPESEGDLAIIAGLGKATTDRLYEACRRVCGEKGEAADDPFGGDRDGSPSSESRRQSANGTLTPSETQCL